MEMTKFLYLIFIGFICLGIVGMYTLAMGNTTTQSNSTPINETVTPAQTPHEEEIVNLTEEEIPIEEVTDEEIPITEPTPSEELIEEATPEETTTTEEVIETPPVEPEIRPTEVLTPVKEPEYSAPTKVPVVSKSEPKKEECTGEIVLKKTVDKSGSVYIGKKYTGKEVEIRIKC